MSSFQFKTVSKLIKKNSFEGFKEELVSIGKSCLVVCGSSLNRYELLCKAINKTKLTLVQICHEPTVDQIESLRASLKGKHFDFIIGVGGGSVLDTAKALAALLPQNSPATDYLEVIGKGLPLQEDPLPTVLIPTTSGTGSEATKNAVLEDSKTQRKISLRSDSLFATLVWLNPTLTLSLPQEVTAHCGFDALTQLLEAYVSNKSNPITDAFCEKGLAYCGSSILKTYLKPDNLNARGEMQLASFYSGVALANAGLGAVHGLAAPLGGLLHAKHGAICASLLFHVTKENLIQLQERDRSSLSLTKYSKASKLLLQKKEATAEDLLNWISDLSLTFKIKSLKSYGLNNENALRAVKNALESNSMKGNPIPLSNESLSKILSNAS